GQPATPSSNPQHRHPPHLSMSAPTTITATETGGPPPGSGMFSTLRWAVKNPPADPTVSFAGKTVLITGANTGLGLEAALKYAALMAGPPLPPLRATGKANGTPPHLTFVNSFAHSLAKKEWIPADGKGLLRLVNACEGYDAQKSYFLVKLVAMAAMLAVAKAT